MSCLFCERAIRLRQVFGLIYTCPHCRQNWWCYNDHYRLYTTVDDWFTVEVIRRRIDIPIMIGTPAIIMPAFARHAVMPEFSICEEEVPCPTLVMAGDQTLSVQWIGDWEPGNVLDRQLAFPLGAELPFPAWRTPENIETFHVPFVGAAQAWPGQECDALVARFGAETSIAYLVSDRLLLKGVQASFVACVVAIGDNAVGVIRPRRFFDGDILATAQEKFSANVAGA